MRSHWRRLVGDYLAAPRALAGVVLVMDARHPLTALDAQFVSWLASLRATPLLALLTKADKLSRSEQAQALAAVRRRLDAAEATLFSSVTLQGVHECRDLLAAWLEQDRENKKPPVKGM